MAVEHGEFESFSVSNDLPRRLHRAKPRVNALLATQRKRIVINANLSASGGQAGWNETRERDCLKVEVRVASCRISNQRAATCSFKHWDLLDTTNEELAVAKHGLTSSPACGV
ncbi:MAG: hypothetical protein HY043_23925 [Verrucomicrobia bacterium]|nr:hypothetical protein [Verrucomicrobiota bacterium]